jgi:hypothetical protein
MTGRCAWPGARPRASRAGGLSNAIQSPSRRAWAAMDAPCHARCRNRQSCKPRSAAKLNTHVSLSRKRKSCVSSVRSTSAASVARRNDESSSASAMAVVGCPVGKLVRLGRGQDMSRNSGADPRARLPVIDKTRLPVALKYTTMCHATIGSLSTRRSWTWFQQCS